MLPSPASIKSCARTGRLRSQDRSSAGAARRPVWKRICSAILAASVPSVVRSATPTAEWRNSVTGEVPRQHEQSRAGGGMSCEHGRSAEARRAAPQTLSSGRPWRETCHARGVSDLIELRDRMRTFTDERDWAKFHDPKSLVLALVGEVGELAELFQWLPADRAEQLAGADPLRQRVGKRWRTYSPTSSDWPTFWMLIWLKLPGRSSTTRPSDSQPHRCVARRRRRPESAQPQMSG